MGDDILTHSRHRKIDEVIKSSVEILVPTPSDSEDFSDLEKKDQFNSTGKMKSLASIHRTDLLESLLNRDSLIDSSQKINSLLDEFAGELTYSPSIPPGNYTINFDSEGDILFLETFV
ncbi:hypothetical protein Tco_1183925 [Tanacetum coccineum]|uniref:Uncharacterized protein n=1 Tax=Tanacetum coccineum TaxID=301880 RepID=A0ABQ5IJE5_9ASTR